LIREPIKTLACIRVPFARDLQVGIDDLLPLGLKVVAYDPVDVLQIVSHHAGRGSERRGVGHDLPARLDGHIHQRYRNGHNAPTPEGVLVHLQARVVYHTATLDDLVLVELHRGCIHRQKEMDGRLVSVYGLLGNAHSVRVVPPADARHIAGQAEHLQVPTGKGQRKACAARFDALAGFATHHEGHPVRVHGPLPFFSLRGGVAISAAKTQAPRDGLWRAEGAGPGGCLRPSCHRT